MSGMTKMLGSHRLQSALLAIVIIAIWEGACRVFDISPLILPAPFAIAARLYVFVGSGTIWPHLWATVVEIVSGFAFGVIAGLVIGAMVSLIPVVERLVYPYLVALQTLPKVAIAPLFIIWFGLVRLRIPSALVLIFAGLEIAAVLAVIGAIVGEFVGAQVGLGYLIVALNFSLDVPGVFAVLIVLSAIGLLMHGAMRYAARRYIFWIRRNEAPAMA